MTPIDDLIKRLRSRRNIVADKFGDIPRSLPDQECHEAADALERLKAEMENAEAEAYERAAQVADQEHDRSDKFARDTAIPLPIRDGWTARRACALELAAAIRQLKDKAVT